MTEAGAPTVSLNRAARPDRSGSVDRSVVVCAHRGSSATHPENTLSAFREAFRLGVDMIELDVAMTLDGALVVLHDATVDRTTDGSGKVHELTLAYVQSLDAGSKRAAAFAGERVPTLGEVLDETPQGCRINVHVKPFAPSVPRLVEAVVGQIVGRGLLRTAYVTADANEVKLASGADHRVTTCNLTGQIGDGTGYIALSRTLGCTICQPNNGIVTREFCQAAHRAGLEIHPFYADDETEMARLIECGVDGILTNCPERMLRFLDRI